MVFGPFCPIDGPGGGCGGFTPPQPPPYTAPRPTLGASPRVHTFTGGFGAGPVGEFPAGCK